MRGFKFLTSLLVAASFSASAQAPRAPETVALYAAGSLREALTVIAQDYKASTGVSVALTFGASGLLRERIEKGEAAQVFASADTEHPARLAKTGAWAAPEVLLRNSLCALSAPDLIIRRETLLDTLLDPAVRLGTSTPLADPSGDYAWQLFRKADTLKAGAYAVLDAKALKLTGAADSPQPPAGRGTYGWLMEQRRADVFLTYCTNAIAARREVPQLKVVLLPVELEVGAAYGVTVRRDAPAAAQRLAAYLLSAPAQEVFQRFGFDKP